MRLIIFFYVFFVTSFSVLKAQSAMVTSDLVYAQTPQGPLHLDLYIPSVNKKDVLVIWIHGGAWRSGDKEKPPMDLVEKGYVMASINYRLSTEATFPAQIHDIKAAIRYLRGTSKGFGINGDKIVLWGSSAGGHLAALAGLSNRDPYLEGILGRYTNMPSDVQGVIDFYGPTNMESILKQSTPHGLDVRIPALTLLYGIKPEEAGNTVNLCSPVAYVDADDPPIFIAHGDQDNQVPINQSIELYGKCLQNGVKANLEFVYGNGHGGYGFESQGMVKKLTDFLESIKSK